MNDVLKPVREAVAAHREPHYQGELRVRSGAHSGSVQLRTTDDRPFAEMWHNGDDVEANGRRAALCWNALVGFPSKTLEDKGFIGAIDAVETALDELAKVLNDALDFIAQQEDASCEDGHWSGNKAMSLAGEIREALAKYAPKEPAHG